MEDHKFNKIFKYKYNPLISNNNLIDTSNYQVTLTDKINKTDYNSMN